MKLVERQVRWRWSGLVFSLVVVCGLLVGTQPAHAAQSAPPHTPDGKASAPAVSNKPWDPRPKLPDPVTIPGKGTKIAPLTTKMEPTGPKSLPGAAKAKANALESTKAAAAGSALRRTAISP